MNSLISCVWGFSVGFVCWHSCYDMIEPLSNYLVGKRAPYVLRFFAQCIICIFGIFFVISLIGLDFIVYTFWELLCTEQIDASVIESGNTFPRALISSHIGLILWAVFQRIRCKTPKNHNGVLYAPR